MMRVITHGQAYVDESIQLTCKVCQCVFEVDNIDKVNKIVYVDPTDNNRAYVAIECPECNAAVEIRTIIPITPTTPN